MHNFKQHFIVILLITFQLHHQKQQEHKFTEVLLSVLYAPLLFVTPELQVLLLRKCPFGNTPTFRTCSASTHCHCVPEGLNQSVVGLPGPSLTFTRCSRVSGFKPQWHWEQTTTTTTSSTSTTTTNTAGHPLLLHTMLAFCWPPGWVRVPAGWGGECRPFPQCPF